MSTRAAKAHYMSGGKIKVRSSSHHARRHAPLGRQHSQSLHAWVSHIPVSRVALAVRPLRGQGPDERPDPRRQPGGHLRGQDDVRVKAGARRGLHDPFAWPRFKRAGTDVTIVATSSMVRSARRRPRCSGDRDQRRGDRPAHDVSPGQAGADRFGKKTSRAIVVDEGYERYGTRPRSRR